MTAFQFLAILSVVYLAPHIEQRYAFAVSLFLMASACFALLGYIK